MKKFSVLIALALLAVAGTGYAVTCAYDNVPAATLLVPHFRVGRNGSTGGDIPAGGVDTLCAVTNVSSTGVIVHVTVWNKYSKAVLDFNVPLTAYDVAYWSMRTVLNGQLNVNPTTQAVSPGKDPCGINQLTGVYAPKTGFGPGTYVRFSNPDTNDATISVSVYAPVAFSGSFRNRVWDSLDESGDIATLTSDGAPYIMDSDNPACDPADQFGDGNFQGDFAGYVTLDVVNYCTNWFPDQQETYRNDAIATAGWGAYNYSPNTIIGDVFYVDSNPNGGNISGDQMVPLEFDNRLDWNAMNTFYGRYALAGFETVAGTGAPLPYRFVGDGREPLGIHYGFRYLSDLANGYQSWAIVWRSDNYFNRHVPIDVNLCDWWASAPKYGGASYGFEDSVHQIGLYTFDNDENSAVVSGGPSGGPPPSNRYIFLETQRIPLGGNGDFNPGGYKGGYVDLFLPGFGTLINAGSSTYNTALKPVGCTLAGCNVPTTQAYVGIQHSGPGLALSVGHSASNLNGGWNCQIEGGFQAPWNSFTPVAYIP